jgi:hypothetical protein
MLVTEVPISMRVDFKKLLRAMNRKLESGTGTILV